MLGDHWLAVNIKEWGTKGMTESSVCVSGAGELIGFTEGSPYFTFSRSFLLGSVVFWEKNPPGFYLGTHESGFQSAGSWLGGFCRTKFNNGHALPLALVELFVSILRCFLWSGVAFIYVISPF